MRTILLCLTLVASITSAKALQFYEAFIFPPDTALAGQGGWILSSGTSPTIQAGTLVQPGLAPAGEGNSLKFGGTPMEVRHAMTNLLGGEQAGTYFYSLTFKVNSVGSMSTAGGFIAALTRSVQADFGGLLYLRKDAGNANGYNIGLAKSSGLGSTVSWDTTVFLPGQTNFVVVKYSTPDQSDTTAFMWINPDPSTYGVADIDRPAPTLEATDGTDLLTGVGQMAFKLVSATAGPGEVIVDQLRVEGGWPHVTPVPLTMNIELIEERKDLFISWGGNQNVLLQFATNLVPPITWTSLNGGLSGSGAIKSYRVENVQSQPSPRFYRLHGWHAE